MALTSPQNENLRIGDIVLWEAGVEVNYCREVVALDAAQTIVPGNTLAESGGTWSLYATEGGTGQVDGIALEYSTASVPATILALVRGPAVVHGRYLVEESTDTAVVADLASLGILIRDEVAGFKME